MNIQRQEGRQHAIDCLQSVIGTPMAMYDERGPLETVLANLEMTARRYPTEYSQGILDVCRELRKCSH